MNWIGEGEIQYAVCRVTALCTYSDLHSYLMFAVAGES